MMKGALNYYMMTGFSIKAEDWGALNSPLHSFFIPKGVKSRDHSYLFQEKKEILPNLASSILMIWRLHSAVVGGDAVSRGFKPQPTKVCLCLTPFDFIWCWVLNYLSGSGPLSLQLLLGFEVEA